MGCVYRLVGMKGETLYVGMTRDADPSRRYRQHCKAQPWAREIYGVQMVRSSVPADVLAKVEAQIAEQLNPKYGNWSTNPLPEKVSPIQREPLVSVCPYAVRLMVSRCGMTLADAATRGDIPAQWPALIAAGEPIAETVPRVRTIAARLDGDPGDLVHRWVDEVAA